MHKIALAFATAAALSITTPARAAVIVTDYTFTGSGIGTGTFSLAFNDATSVYSLSAFDFTLGVTHYDLSFTAVAPYAANTLIIYDSFNGSFVSGPFDDFSFLFNTLNPGPQASEFTYFLQGQVGTRGATIVIQPVSGAVPEASTWAMMLLGFGAIGVAMRRRKKIAALA